MSFCSASIREVVTLGNNNKQKTEHKRERRKQRQTFNHKQENIAREKRDTREQNDFRFFMETWTHYDADLVCKLLFHNFSFKISEPFNKFQYSYNQLSSHSKSC